MRTMSACRFRSSMKVSGKRTNYFMNLPASKIKSSALEDSSARSLNDGNLTHMLFQVCTANESLYELCDCQRTLTRGAKNYDASMALGRVGFEIKKIRVE